MSSSFTPLARLAEMTFEKMACSWVRAASRRRWKAVGR
jgi:hypothetical protein